MYYKETTSSDKTSRAFRWVLIMQRATRKVAGRDPKDGNQPSARRSSDAARRELRSGSHEQGRETIHSHKRGVSRHVNGPLRSGSNLIVQALTLAPSSKLDSSRKAGARRWRTILACAAMACTLPAAAEIDVQLEQASSTRISRTVFQYDYRVHATNSGDVELTAVRGIATSQVAATQIIEGDIELGTISPGDSIEAASLLRLRHNRRYPFDPDAIAWTFEFTSVPANEPPLAALTLATTRVSESIRVDLDASASEDPEGSVLSFEFDFDGDGEFDTGPVTESTTSFYVTEPASFGPRVRVTDDGGASSIAVAGEIASPFDVLEIRLIPLDATGASITFDESSELAGVEVEVMPGTFDDAEEFSVAINHERTPANPELVLVSRVYDFEVFDHSGPFQQPLQITLPFDLSQIEEHGIESVFIAEIHEDGRITRVNSRDILEYDTTVGKITFRARHFSEFCVLQELPDANYSTTDKARFRDAIDFLGGMLEEPNDVLAEELLGGAEGQFTPELKSNLRRAVEVASTISQAKEVGDGLLTLFVGYGSGAEWLGPVADLILIGADVHLILSDDSAVPLQNEATRQAAARLFANSTGLALYFFAPGIALPAKLLIHASFFIADDLIIARGLQRDRRTLADRLQRYRYAVGSADLLYTAQEYEALSGNQVLSSYHGRKFQLTTWTQFRRYSKPIEIDVLYNAFRDTTGDYIFAVGYIELGAVAANGFSILHADQVITVVKHRGQAYFTSVPVPQLFDATGSALLEGLPGDVRSGEEITLQMFVIEDGRVIYYSPKMTTVIADPLREIVAAEINPRQVAFDRIPESSAIELVGVTRDGTRFDLQSAFPGLCTGFSSNPEIASIDIDLGLVSAMGPGETDVEVTCDNITASAHIVVDPSHLRGVHNYSVESVVSSAAFAAQGEVLSISGIIRNTGLVAEGVANTALIVNGQLIEEKSISPLGRGASIAVEFAWTVPEGVVFDTAVRVMLDRDDYSVDDTLSRTVFSGTSRLLSIDGSTAPGTKHLNMAIGSGLRDYVVLRNEGDVPLSVTVTPVDGGRVSLVNKTDTNFTLQPQASKQFHYDVILGTNPVPNQPNTADLLVAYFSARDNGVVNQTIQANPVTLAPGVPARFPIPDGTVTSDPSDFCFTLNISAYRSLTEDGLDWAQLRFTPRTLPAGGGRVNTRVRNGFSYKGSTSWTESDLNSQVSIRIRRSAVAGLSSFFSCLSTNHQTFSLTDAYLEILAWQGDPAVSANKRLDRDSVVIGQPVAISVEVVNDPVSMWRTIRNSTTQRTCRQEHGTPAAGSAAKRAT